MMVHFGNTGQLGNQLLSVAHLLASSLEHDFFLETYACDSFVGYLSETHKSFPHNFAFRRSEPWIMRGLTGRVVRRLFEGKSWILYNKKIVFDYRSRRSIEQEAFLSFAKSSKQFIYCGWLFRDFESLFLQQNKVRAILLPKCSTDKMNSDKFKIGLHIRRGDYRIWRGGVHYYDDSVYLRICRDAIRQYSNEGKVEIYPVSDERLTLPEKLDGVCLRYKGQQHRITDLTLLSNCDLVIGPPSTFSQAAAFLGDVPKFTILSKDDSFSKEGLELYADHVNR